MAKTRMMVKQVLMSIVTLVSFVMAQYEDFNRVTRGAKVPDPIAP